MINEIKPLDAQNFLRNALQAESYELSMPLYAPLRQDVCVIKARRTVVGNISTDKLFLVYNLDGQPDFRELTDRTIENETVHLNVTGIGCNNTLLEVMANCEVNPGMIPPGSYTKRIVYSIKKADL